MQRIENLVIILSLILLTACRLNTNFNHVTNLQSTQSISTSQTQVAAALEATSNSTETEVIHQETFQSKEVIQPANANHLVTSLVMHDIVSSEMGFIATGNSIVLLGSKGLATIDFSQANLIPKDVELFSSTITETQLALLSLSKTDETIAWVREERYLEVMDLQIPNSDKELTYSESPITGMAISGDRGEIVFSSYDGTINLWNLNNAQEKESWSTTSWLKDLSYSPDGRYFSGVDTTNFIAYVYNVENGQVVDELEWLDTASPLLYAAYFSPDWKTLAWVARSTIQLMDTADGNLGPILNHEDYINAVAWSPDGRLLAVASAASLNNDLVPVIVLWEVSDGSQLNLLPQIVPVIFLAFSPDGTSLAFLTSNNEMHLLDVRK